MLTRHTHVEDNTPAQKYNIVTMAITYIWSHSCTSTQIDWHQYTYVYGRFHRNHYYYLGLPAQIIEINP